MTLLELLRQELPKRGGWPEGVTHICQDGDKYIAGYTSNPIKESAYDWGNEGYVGGSGEYSKTLASDHATAIVTREQYEATGWDGTGLPPVGCECEYQYKVHGSEWCSFECVAVDGNVAFGWSNNTPTALQLNTHNFRPLRSEAEKKRNEATHAMASAPKPCGHSIHGICCEIYDAIAAGKIPGVKLEV